MFSLYPKTSFSAEYNTYSRNNAENRYVRRDARCSTSHAQNHQAYAYSRSYGDEHPSLEARRRASDKARSARPTKRATLNHSSYVGSPHMTNSFKKSRSLPGGGLQKRGFLIACIVVVSLIVIGAMTWCGSYAAQQLITRTAPAHASQAVSTPQSEWKKGSIPYLYQTDTQWAQTPYAEDRIELSGCGPTCLSMVYIGLTGDKRMDPVACARYSERNDYIEGGATRWSLMEEGAEDLGLTSEGVPVSKQAVIETLQDGKPLIMSVAPGDFTSVGHFLVVEALDDQGKLVIHDPNSPENSAVHWDVGRVVSQARGIWAFSV